MAGMSMPKRVKKPEEVIGMGEIELTDHRAMIYLPEDAVEVNILVKVYYEGEIREVYKQIGMSELRDAFRKADEGYIDDDDTFMITDKGVAWLEEHKKES